METKACQNCTKNFTIEPEDFVFYTQMQVPPPTFCPDCRLQRRYAWRNERSLFHASCGLCKKNILAMYPPERTYPVFCRECWLGDGWDPTDFGQDYDFSRSFFTQAKELMDKIPWMGLMQVSGVNSDYANGYVGARNAYLSYSVVESEDVLYSKNIDRSRQVIDCLCVSDSERLVHTVYSAGSYDMVHSHQVRSCMNGMFLFDCINSSYCFMSANLRNGKYIFRGNQCTKEEYEKLLKEIDFESYEVWSALIKEFTEMKQGALHKYADILKSVDTTGDALTNMKNCKTCFEAYDSEDSKWFSRGFGNKNVYDVNNMLKSELVYEYNSLGAQSSRVMFSFALNSASNDVGYSACSSGSYLFGCFGMINKKYCILNKQYTEEEYTELLPKIIEHMKAMPYVDAKGRTYRFGEFFPIEFSPFAYNESDSQEYFPLTQKEIEEYGYRYHAQEEKNHKVTKAARDLPDALGDVADDILKEVIGCEHADQKCLHQCTQAFRITADELAMYRRFHLPLPRICPNCRHYKRLEYRKPWKLWHRTCMCEMGHHGHDGVCINEFETSYSPERQEKVYCEGCYQKEVI